MLFLVGVVCSHRSLARPVVKTPTAPTAPTHRVEAALARTQGGQRVLVVPTEERLAKLVGAILHVTTSDSDKLADAHVVAVAFATDVALVVPSGPEDIVELAVAVPATRVS
jgi:hypothetical protein